MPKLTSSSAVEHYDLSDDDVHKMLSAAFERWLNEYHPSTAPRCIALVSVDNVEASFHVTYLKEHNT